MFSWTACLMTILTPKVNSYIAFIFSSFCNHQNISAMKSINTLPQQMRAVLDCCESPVFLFVLLRQKSHSILTSVVNLLKLHYQDL